MTPKMCKHVSTQEITTYRSVYRCQGAENFVGDTLTNSLLKNKKFVAIRNFYEKC